MARKALPVLLVISAVFLLGILSGCAPTPTADDQASGPSAGSDPPLLQGANDNDPPGEDQSAAPQSNNSQPTSGEIASGSASSPTPAPIQTRPVPDDFEWRTLPVMPELSDNVVTIYQSGIQQGRNPANFSVIGDCQGIPFVFMGPIGRKEVLPPGHEQSMWDTIDQFDGSFLHESTSVRGGFTAASIFNPMQADPVLCKPGETPLTCEYRLHNPAFIFITLETWADPDSIDRFEIYLREIVEYVIQNGTVPILITKADAAEVRESIHILNPAIAKIAYEYDVPLVNFWRAAQNLPNRGIDPDKEGFHLLQEGFDLKNLLALQALTHVRQKIETDLEAGKEASDPAIAEVQPTETPESSPQVPDFEILANPACTGGCIFFGMAQSLDGEVEPIGVFAYEHETKSLVQILPAGFDLQDIHPDGNLLLVNQKNFLYAIDMENSSAELVSDDLYWLGEKSAYWAGNGSKNIIQIDTQTAYQGDSGRAIGLFPASRGRTVYFMSGSCESKDFCTSEGVYQELPGQTPALMDNPMRTVFSPDGNWYASLDPEAATEENGGNINYLYLQDPNADSASRRIVYLPFGSGFRVFPDVRTFAFSPNSDMLFVFYDYYSLYFERSVKFETYLLGLDSMITLEEYGGMIGNFGSFRPKIVWSPDGARVLLFLTNNESDEAYSLSVYETVIGGQERLIPISENLFTSPDYFYITNIGWQRP